MRRKIERVGTARQRCPTLTTNLPMREVRQMAIYRVRPCSFCGKSFQPTTSRNKHCSPECRFSGIAFVKTESGCWEWPMSLNVDSGYGQFFVRPGGMPITSHRMAWITFRGPIPSGLHVLHRCDNRKCCNPDHLWLGTNTDNVHDMISKGRAVHQDHAKDRERTAKAWKTRRLNSSVTTKNRPA